MGMQIFSSPEIDVYHHIGTSDFATVMFAPMNWAGPTGDFWGRSVAEKLAITTIGVTAKRPNWYPVKDMNAAAPAIRAALKSHRVVVTYGASMGGYAALKFGTLLGATVALAFSPQVSIAPDDVARFDPRFLDYYSADLHRGMAIREADICRFPLVFYDSCLYQDRRHADYVGHHCPRMQRVVASLTGHATIGVFASSRKLGVLLQLAIAGDVPAIRQLTAAAIKESSVRKHEIISKLITRERYMEYGLAAFQKHRSTFNNVQAARILMRAAKTHLSQSAPALAVGLLQQALDLHPRETNAMMLMSDACESLGDYPASIAWAERALALRPDDMRLTSLLRAKLSALTTSGVGTMVS